MLIHEKSASIRQMKIVFTYHWEKFYKFLRNFFFVAFFVLFFVHNVKQQKLDQLFFPFSALNLHLFVRLKKK